MSRNKTNDLNLIKQAAKLYDQNLLEKNILFIYLNKNKIEYYEVTFLKEHFKHLTGVYSELNAYMFFYKARNNILKASDFEYKNNTTGLKIDNLINAMILNTYAKMIGEFKQNKIYLSIQKMAGNNNLIIGFDSGRNINYPKTLLKGDIRDYCREKPCRIIAIFRKNLRDKLYKEVKYLSKNITINRVLKEKDLIKIIDIKNLNIK